MNINLFDYYLPEELIAQSPSEKRDHSRLLAVNRETHTYEDKHFYDICDKFFEHVKESLRKSDLVMRYRKNQVFVFLTDIKEFAISQVIGGIKGSWHKENGDIVSDVSSAPGGKSFTAAVRMCGKGIVYSYDIYPHKIKLIEDTAERLGINNIKVSLRDALSDIPLNESDKIICDVPCSGLGVLRRKPEIRYKEDTGINSLPDIQLKILENTAKYLKSGGVLVYSTCTLNKEENSGVVNRFLSAHTDFEPCPIILPNGIKRTIDEPVHMLTLFPQTNNTDGFFICTIKKR